MVEAHEAAEAIRIEQQGHGRSIVSFLTAEGHRAVAVKDKVYCSTDWRVFPDFLLHFMKEVMGRAWGESQLRSGSNHPLFLWLEKVKSLKRLHHREGVVIQSMPMTAAAAATHQLAYSLYLMAHHDHIPKLLLKRLRQTETFLPAYYELLVGAVLAVAGFEIELQETRRTAQATPDFRARSKRSGLSYVVEAKCRTSWGPVQKDIEDPAFRDRLAKYIGGRISDATAQLRKATSGSEERLIVCIELNLDTIRTEAEWRKLSAMAQLAIAEDEARNRAGHAPPSAYVLITNHTFLADVDGDTAPMFAALLSFGIPGLLSSRPTDLEDALEMYDRHRDAFWITDCLRIARSIPVTFDGAPSELLNDDGTPSEPVRIGSRIQYPDHEGTQRAGVISEISSRDDSALAVVTDEKTARQSIITLPLSNAEARAAREYGDRVFGRAAGARKIEDGDLFGMYEFFLEAYGNATRDVLLKIIDPHPRSGEWRKLTTTDLRIRVCREHARTMYIERQARAPSGRTPKTATISAPASVTLSAFGGKLCEGGYRDLLR